jgi:hypothetical protein
VKTISLEGLRARFESVEKSPPKARELRAARPPSRIEGREQDALADTARVKFAQRSRKNAKLRFFRIFKLFPTLKLEETPRSDDARFRPIAERLRLQRWMRRL